VRLEGTLLRVFVLNFYGLWRRWGYRSGVAGVSVLLKMRQCQRITGCPKGILLWHLALEDEDNTLFRNVRIPFTIGTSSYPRRTECKEELVKVKFIRLTCAVPIHLLVNTTLRPLYPRSKDRYPLYRGLVGSWGLYRRHGKSGKSHPTGIRSGGQPARNNTLYRQRYPYRQRELVCSLIPVFRTLYHDNSIICTEWTVSQRRRFFHLKMEVGSPSETT